MIKKLFFLGVLAFLLWPFFSGSGFKLPEQVTKALDRANLTKTPTLSLEKRAEKRISHGRPDMGQKIGHRVSHRIQSLRNRVETFFSSRGYSYTGFSSS